MTHPLLPRSRRHLALTLLALAAAVALAHWALWQELADGLWSAQNPRPSPSFVQVRTVTSAAAPPAETAHPEVVARPAPVPAPTPRRAPDPATPAPIEPVQPATMSPEAPLVAAVLPAQPMPELTPVANPVAPEEVPVYRTQMPPAMTLGYELTYGRWTGSGELHWRPQAEGYEARLEGRVAMLKIITLVSQGRFDAAGLAPQRYTDHRRGRGEQAANFQRQAGKISFSGSANEYPLLQGAQDRLSWMIQLAAITLADPKRVAAGGRIVLYVVGARGDADVWAFHVEATEEVSTPDGKLKTVKLVREPRKPHDTRVEVWLAPSLHYLPVRARQTTDNSTWDLRLQSAQAPI